MNITVGIKALNEERHIASSLASAVKAMQPFEGEVILADSGSTDRTVEIARNFPVRIVQLANTAERSCGAGAQLAFQHARGAYFYLLDGDMVLDRDFLPAGIAYLEANPDVAAVGGHVRERNTEGEDFQIRATNAQKDWNRLPGIVDRLDCGGLYRAAAVREAGYFADRNLHAFEEFELAARLQSLGWKLARIDHPAVDHYGHTAGGYRLLWRRIRSGYAGCTGEVLRGAIGCAHLPIVLRKLDHIRICVAVILWWGLLMAGLTVSPYASLAILLLPLLFLSFRRRSPKLGLYSLAVWNVTAWGLLSGLLRHRVPPATPLASVELSVAQEERDSASRQASERLGAR
ncbi:MAG TPA: glycosyltransferase [Terracidiphilus sp.]|jgi:glycosyltransferase involved in cell wall biosynthesis